MCSGEHTVYSVQIAHRLLSLHRSCLYCSVCGFAVLGSEMRCAVLMLEYLKSLCASLVCSTEIATEIAYALSLQSDSRYCDSVCRTAAKQSVVLRSRMCGQGRSGDGGRRRVCPYTVLVRSAVLR